MLISIIKKCYMGCSHCMFDCKPTDTEMLTFDQFKKSIDLANKINSQLIIISGGEPTEHPLFLEFLTYAYKNFNKSIMVASNGMFAFNELYKKKIIGFLNTHKRVLFQITADKRFYPKTVPIINHLKVCYTSEIPTLSSKGRAKTNNLSLEKLKIKSPICPNCFNIFSAFKNLKDILKAASFLENNFNKYCSFGVTWNGEIGIGENCHIIGTLESNIEELNKNMAKFKPCNKCGAVDNLSEEIRRYIYK